jgi:hypothetical protein
VTPWGAAGACAVAADSEINRSKAGPVRIHLASWESGSLAAAEPEDGSKLAAPRG